MAKAGYVKVRLESEAGTGYRYYAKRSTRAEYKIRKKKYDPWALNEETGKKGMHVF
ncbi:MAG: 50S ribosomal protein L33, partial [Alphaproteobacteria bacterium]|nr:50S ribosomal protein L33 [Alphaproteobacteria bacterium]